MKKVTVALGSIALICLLTVSVLAGDLPEVVKTDTSIDVMLCRVEAESEDEMTVEVLRAERHSVEIGEQRTLERPLLWKSAEKQCKPQVGDELLLSVVASEEDVKLYDPLVCAYVKSDEDGEVKLVTAGSSMLKRMEEYLNAGAFYLPEKSVQPAASISPTENPEAGEAEEPAQKQSGKPWLAALPVLCIAAICIAQKVRGRT